MALLLAACGGGSDDDGGTTDSIDMAEVMEAADRECPQPGDVLEQETVSNGCTRGDELVLFGVYDQCDPPLVFWDGLNGGQHAQIGSPVVDAPINFDDYPCMSD